MGASVLIPWLVGLTIDEVDRGQRDALAVLGVAIAAAGLLRLAFSVARRLVAGQVSLGVEYDLRNRMYGHLQRLELGFFDHSQTGQLMSRATVDLQAVRFFLGYGLVFIVQSALTILLAASAMVIMNPSLALLVLWPVPFVVVVATRFGHRSRPALGEVQQRIAELTAAAEENISGVRVIKAFAREAHQLAGFRRSVARLFGQSMVATRLRAFYNPLLAFLPNLGLAALLFFGGRAVIDGTISKGEFVAFYTYVLMLLGPMRMLGISLGMAQRATASGERVFELLDREPRMTAPDGAPPLPQGPGRIELRGVTFAYEGASEPALRSVDLEIEPGHTVALVGATGSGKTTLAALVPRLYDVTEGAVLVDGADVRTVDPTSLRQEIAVVADDPFLFSATVHENIAYARGDATRAEVEAAARLAQAHEFVAALPGGYDARIGERGFTLSGGQRQRIAIARALIANPRILILDDATSSLDSSTEREIKAALRAAKRGRTTIVIAHRLSTVALADEIVVLEHGRIAARGGHDELLERSPLYREIVEKGMPDQVFLTRKPLEAEVAGL